MCGAAVSPTTLEVMMIEAPAARCGTACLQSRKAQVSSLHPRENVREVAVPVEIAGQATEWIVIAVSVAWGPVLLAVPFLMQYAPVFIPVGRAPPADAR
jgi:hypothetical protein